MSHKKHGSRKRSVTASPVELLAAAEKQLVQGQIDAALDAIEKAARELAPRPAPPGKKITIPPHIIAAQQSLPRLRARALAARARTASDPHRMVSILKEAIESDPTAAGYRLALGAARLLLGENPQALIDFSDAQQRAPDHPLLARAFALAAADETGGLSVESVVGAHLVEGLSAAARGEWARAAEALAELPTISSPPTRADAARVSTQLYYTGLLAALDGRRREAIGDWREAARLARNYQLALPWIKRFPDDLRRTAAAAGGEMELARECWRIVLNLSPSDAEAQAQLTAVDCAQALEDWRAGRTAEAAALWERILTVSPGEHGIRRNLAIAFEKLERPADAGREWKTLAREQRRRFKQKRDDAGSIEQLLLIEKHLVKLMLTAGADSTEVFNEIEAVLSAAPDSDELRLWAADALIEIGRPQPALKHLEAIEKRRGASGILLLRKGIVLEILNRHAEARRAFERALELDPDNAVARRTMVLFLGQEAVRADDRNDSARAIDYCQEQLAIDPNYESALAHLGKLFFSTGRDEDARRHLARLTSIEPRDARRLVAAGSIYLDAGRKKEAAALFKDALALDAGPECLFQIGDVYQENRSWKEAIKYFDRAVEAGVGIEMLAHIISKCYEQGRKKDGDRYLKTAFRRYPDHPLPHMIKGIERMTSLSPIDLMFNSRAIDEILEVFETAEKMCVGRPEYAEYLGSIREIREHVAEHPILQLVRQSGGRLPEFLFDDDDDDDDRGFVGDGGQAEDDFITFIERPPRSKKPRRRR